MTKVAGEAPATDHELVRSARAGDRIASGRLYQRYVHKVPLAERERLLDLLSQFVPIPDGYTRGVEGSMQLAGTLQAA